MRFIQVTCVSLMFIILAACNQKEQETSARPSQNYEVVADQLTYPWSIEMADNTFYLTERNGTIVEVKDGNKIRQKLTTTKPIAATGEGGLLGLVLAPNFAQTKQAYTYHTYNENGTIKNRIILIEKTSDGWREVRQILGDIPGGAIHNGGRLAIGPDHQLYSTTGDTGKDELAQNKTSLAGKILRITLNGDIPSDNPFPNSPVYSYGHRNVQGIAWNKDGSMYASEHGPSPMGGHDEINKIEPGKNYGWPVIIGDQKKEGMETPLYQTGNETWAPSGIKVNEQNEILITCLRGEKLVKYSISDGSVQTVLNNVGRIRDVYLMNNDLYVITSNGQNDKLIKISN